MRPSVPMPGGFKADQPMSVEANGLTAGPPQGEVSPLREAATRAAADVGANGLTAGPSQGEVSPLREAAPRAAADVGANGLTAGPPQGEVSPLRGAATRAAADVGANGLTAGPPQGEVSPLREAATRAAADVGVNGLTAGPPQGEVSPLGGQRPAQRRSVGAIIVDLDGTMVDTLGDFEVALNRTLAGFDLPPVTRALVERTVGKGSEHLIRSVLDHQLALPEVTAYGRVCVGRSDVLFEPAWQAYQRHYQAINGQFSAVYPGVMEGLQAWRDQGLPMACLTNKPLAFAQGLLKSKGLDGFFDQVFGGDSFERKKPDPMPLLKTCEALGVVPSETLMVGDSQNDGLAARAAGCLVALVTYGYNHGEPIEQAPHDWLLHSLAEGSTLAGAH